MIYGQRAQRTFTIIRPCPFDFIAEESRRFRVTTDTGTFGVWAPADFAEREDAHILSYLRSIPEHRDAVVGVQVRRVLREGHSPTDGAGAVFERKQQERTT